MKTTAYGIWKWEHDFNQSLVEHYQHILDVMIRTSVKSVDPPIKGKITPGKLKWRGMKLCSQNKGHDGIYYWIEQRGKIVGEKLLISVNVNFK